MPHLTSKTMRTLTAGAALGAASLFGFHYWQGPITANERGSDHPAAVAGRENAQNLSDAFRKAADVTLPTVVTIESHSKPHETRGQGKGRMQVENPFQGTPFEDFFKDDMPFGFRFDDGQGMHSFRTPPRHGMGSGVIVDRSGIVLTNNHVVEGADEVTVRLADGREFKAQDIKTDPETDLAVLRIEGAGSLPAARLGDSDGVQIGDWVIAVGNPFGFDSTVSAGIISSKGRELPANKRIRLLQTDAAINPGNSGGPLVNLDGEVVGINTAIASSNGGFQGIGFAIPSNQARWVMKQLIEKGTVARSWLGVGIEKVNADLARQFGIDRRDGVIVAEIRPNSPAAEAGFEEGDVVVAYGGKPIHTPRDLQELVERTPVDSRQAVKVLRNGREMELQVVVKTMPSDAKQVAADDEKPNRGSTSNGYADEELGLEVADLTPATARRLGYEGLQGVVITEVAPDGIAAQAGLRTGDLIMRVGKQKIEVDSVAAFKKALSHESVKDGVLLLVRTNGHNAFLVLEKK